MEKMGINKHLFCFYSSIPAVVNFPYLADEESNVTQPEKEELRFELRILVICLSTLPGLSITVGRKVCFYNWCDSSGHIETKSHGVPVLPPQRPVQSSLVIRHNGSGQLAWEVWLQSRYERDHGFYIDCGKDIINWVLVILNEAKSSTK